MHAGAQIPRTQLPRGPGSYVALDARGSPVDAAGLMGRPGLPGQGPAHPELHTAEWVRQQQSYLLQQQQQRQQQELPGLQVHKYCVIIDVAL